MSQNPDLLFKTGNICRIYIKNFLTFNEVEVRPKPKLNIICGPNGSGKSTMLCALCLCLGGKPAVIGRSKELFDYVKIGESEAVLEVEVFVEGEVNVVVTHKINSRTRKSTWSLQGREVTHKTAMSKIERLSVQVDNLCQFLPQDRVVSFAKMNPRELLMATEKAVGDPSLHEDHTALCTSGQLLTALVDNIKDLTAQVGTAERKNARLKDVVDNLEVKVKLEEELKQLRTQHVWYLYDQKRKIHEELKDKLSAKLSELKTLNNQMTPSLDKIKEKRTCLGRVKAQVKEKTSHITKTHQDSRTLRDRCDQLADTHREALTRYAQQCQDDQDKRQDLDDFRRQLDVLMGQLQNIPGLDEEAVASQLMDLTNKIHRASQKIASLQGQNSDLLMNKDSKTNAINTHRNELMMLQDVKGQRMRLLNQYNKDAYRAAQWVQNNIHAFKSTIYPPICALINLKDKDYARYIENRVMERDLVAFVCQDRDDMNKLKREMDKQKMCVNIVYANADNLPNFRPPIPLSEIRKYGFDTYMLQCIEAPPAVLSFLCQNYALHSIPIGINGGDFDAVPTRLSVFYLGNSRYSRSVSRYDSEVSTSIFPVGNTKLLKVVVNQDRIATLTTLIQKLESGIMEDWERLKEIKEEEQQVSKNLESWRNEKRVLSSRKEERRMLQQRIEHKNNQIKKHEANTIDLEAAKIKMKETVQKCIREQVRVISRWRVSLEAASTHVRECQKVEGKARVVGLEISTLEDSVKVWQDNINEMKNTAAAMAREVEQKKLEARDALTKLKNMLCIVSIKEITPQIKSRFQKSSLEDTENKLAEKDAHLSCLITASANELQEYRNGQKQLAKLKDTLEHEQRKLETHQNDLDGVKERWLPHITQLVTNINDKFSQFMARMGYAGEVELNMGGAANKEGEGEDYANYGIAIRVKFHSDQKLQQLTAQQQSGGERAVSTALYLLALQSLTAAPFRCVDEINQGMDKVNERKMLEMLIETEGRDDSSQYFFVTPKLLQNVEYEGNVNIMVVFNSPTTLTHRRLTFKRVMRRKMEANRRKVEGLA